jgi:surfactin synthase thioesterase subunit
MTETPKPTALVCWNPSSPSTKALVCIPWAGAGAAPFRQWVSVIGRHARIYGVRLAGREARIREPPATALGIVIAELTGAITHLREDRVDMFGHCSGAILAFEIARALRDETRPALGRLIVAGQVAPRLFAESAQTATDTRRYLPEDLRHDAEWTELLMSIMAADLQAFAQYTYEVSKPLDIPITAVRSRSDTYVSDADLAAWSEETTGSLACRGVHNADPLFSGPAWRRLANEVLQALR